MKAHAGMDVRLQSLSTAVDGGERSVPRAGHFIPEERANHILSALPWFPFFFLFLYSRHALYFKLRHGTFSCQHLHIRY
jgi:hypothetical protein